MQLVVLALCCCMLEFLALVNFSFIFNFPASFWIICFCCQSSAAAINWTTFIFSLSLSLSLDDLDDLVSLNALELLGSSESFDFFQFMLPLSDTLLLLDEHFHDLALWAAFLSQQCTFLLKEHTWMWTSSNQLSPLPLSSSPNNWLYSWCTSNNILKMSLNCFIFHSNYVFTWKQ